MPSASANISAKFIAQIEISNPYVSSASSPAELTRPRIVSISGSPAATSDPKASRRMIIVTGQEKSSDFIIAVAVGGVEVAPHPRGAGQRDADIVRSERVQLALQRVGGRDHRGRVALRAGSDDRRMPVGGDRRAGPRSDDGGDLVICPQCPLDRRDRRPEAGVTHGLTRGVHDNHQRRAGETCEVGLDQLPRLHRLGAVRLPAGTGERRLDLRSEEAEADRDDHPHNRDDTAVVNRPAAEPPTGPTDSGCSRAAGLTRGADATALTGATPFGRDGALEQTFC